MSVYQQLLALFAYDPQRKCCADMGIGLQGARIILQMPSADDCGDCVKLRRISADFITPWEPLWPKDALTASYYMRQWRRFARRWVQDREYAFHIFRREMNGTTGGLLGGITITDIKRGPFQSATLGYWMGVPFAGQGLMREAIECIVPFAFQQLALNRLEATCMPENDRGMALLRRVGFREVGLSKNYMQINGAVRDHMMFEKTKP